MKNKPTALSIALWVIALAITVRLTWLAHQHGLSTLDVATIAVSAAFTTKAGGEVLATSISRTFRKSGAAR